jgi:hypothetical protein
VTRTRIGQSLIPYRLSLIPYPLSDPQSPIANREP